MNKKKDGCQNGFELLTKYRGAIMGIAALSIYYFHAWTPLTLEPQESSIIILSFIEHVYKEIGFLGVDIFFLLSGIGLTFAIKKESLAKFYYRRMRRIILPFVTIGIIRGITQNWSWATIIGNITGFNFYAKDVNSFLWFVPAIITLYLFFPLYYKFFSKSQNKIIFTSSVIVIWLFITLLVRNTMRYDLFGFTNRIPVFAIGILIGYLIQNHKGIVFSIHTYISLILILILGLYLAYLTSYKEYELIVPMGNCFLPTLLIAVSSSFLIAKLLDMINNRFAKIGIILIKILEFFGIISLEFYCVQSWFVDIITLLLEDGWSKHLVNLSIFLLVTSTAWLMSVLFKYFWEFVEHLFRGKNKAS